MPRLPLATLVLLAACGTSRLRAGAEAPCREARVDPAALRAHVEALATRFAPRDFDHPANLDRAAVFLQGELTAAGAAVSEQVYEVEGHAYRNVAAPHRERHPRHARLRAHGRGREGRPLRGAGRRAQDGALTRASGAAERGPLPVWRRATAAATRTGQG